MISDYVIKQIWSRFAARPAEVWICPRGDRVELKIVKVEPWVQGARLVGNYTGAVLLADFTDDVRAAESEFERGI
ncbi:MAG: hypothetical protein BGP24_14725 [Lysobacterales bacterium 69-70]|nr:hypothetical protein [Xanthomonadaceae bacterium]ODU35340.1 MAG: hypothetical protein ABS97_05555 [Xanthomonadaceae bacterium SCN 69-320]ODV17196.1 MAG: hypothetical protein ABT27_17685 [Xanthomonadaceae bacterium SCN 69-25]OJY94237.1 MAG: hypothetical protein BGP24_14725 [Xanthomonadales bacterium 69-70]